MGTKQDELLCDNENWTLGDHLNTIRDIVKSDGTVVDHLEYNSFGKLISVTKNPDSTFFAYTGKLTDKNSDLQWNINRWYDSEVGRWMSEDPIGFESNDTNIYRYVNNLPLLLIDVYGLRIEYKSWSIERIHGTNLNETLNDKIGRTTIDLEISTYDRYNTSYTVVISASAYFYRSPGWFSSSISARANANKNVIVQCDPSTGKIEVFNCSLVHEREIPYASAQVATLCSISNDEKSVKVFVGGASASSLSGQTIGLGVNLTIAGTGGGFNYTATPDTKYKLGTSWEWSYKCKCTTNYIY
jgi:RHS repeat-associated protein